MAIKLKKWLMRYTRKSVRHQKGFAIIFVLSFIAVLITIVGDVVYQTQIVAKHTMASQDQMQAQGTALTGMSIGRMLMKFHTTLKSPKYEMFASMLPPSLYKSLNGMPIGKETFDKNSQLAEAFDEKLFNTLKTIPGYFVLNINSESCKFNLNLLQPGITADAETALRNILTTPDAEKILNIYRLNGNTIVDNFKAYLSKIKRPLLSVQELRMVDGFQYDDIYDIYAPYFTVWPQSVLELTTSPPPRLNINCAPIELLASIFREPRQDMNSTVWKNFALTREKGTIYKKSTDLSDFWLTNNLKSWNTGTVHSLLQSLIGFKDSVYRLESKGVVNKTEQKLVFILHINNASENGAQSEKFVIDYSEWNPSS